MQDTHRYLKCVIMLHIRVYPVNVAGARLAWFSKSCPLLSTDRGSNASIT